MLNTYNYLDNKIIRAIFTSTSVFNLIVLVITDKLYHIVYIITLIVW